MKDFNIEQEIAKAPVAYQDDLKKELAHYQRIQEATKQVLSEVGVETKNTRVIELLENTGLAGYDSSTCRLHVLPELIDQALDSAPKTFSGDEGMNTLGIGGIPPFLYRADAQYPMPASYEELDRVIKIVAENLASVVDTENLGAAGACEPISELKLLANCHLLQNQKPAEQAGDLSRHDAVTQGSCIALPEALPIAVERPDRMPGREIVETDFGVGHEQTCWTNFAIGPE